ncbi:hypothetical protein [Staphylococcus haemolyticus]|uniref:hypothetical protein n=1 Tax=Staphylococcus haemolyticus TaxID=1283 RepID=UPI00069CD6BE|nr:hypothetical protein [Staphylococcus haemolyticus]
MNDKMRLDTVIKVLEASKNDIIIWDILSEFDDEQDEEIIDFIEEYIDEFNIFLNTALSHITNRLKLRMAFANSKEEQ